jgi:spoIIIJ-associated protein
MTRSLEFEGKTVEHAAEEAAKELNIEKKALQYRVLSYGSTGIFGLVGTRKARIRVSLPKDKPADSTPPPPTGKEDVPEKKPPTVKVSEETGEAGGSDKDLMPPDTPIPDDIISACTNVLEQIVNTITADTEIQMTQTTEQLAFNIKGGNPAVLIGKRGQTLEAIQYLIEKVANKGNHRRVRIEVDVEGYLETRRNNLEKMATRLAEKAVRTGKPMTVGQMNAHDRRIVHLVLKNETEVRTQSMGDGLYRKLMIFPKKGNQRPRRPASQ